MIQNDARFRIKRGREQDLRILDAGEPAFTTDTKKFFIGTGSENVRIGGEGSGGDGGVTRIPGLVTANDFGVSPSTSRGNSASLQALINSVRADFIASNMTTQPIVHLEGGVYILDAEVKMSPYLKFKTLGTVIFKITHNGTGIHITPNENDPDLGSGSEPHLFKSYWQRGKFFDGNFIFTSSLQYNSGSTNTVALEIGPRTNAFTDTNAVARYTIEQINIYGVATGIKLNTYQHYIGTIENCHIELTKNAIVWGNQGSYPVNSGEKFVVKNCVIAGASQGPIKLNTGSIDLTLENTSFDFNASPIVYITESGVGLRMVNCYIEEIEGASQNLIYCKPWSTDATWGRNTVVLNGVQMLLRNKSKIITNDAYNGRRTIMTLSISGLEVRHINTNDTFITPQQMYLVDTDESIIMTQKDLLPFFELQNCLLSAQGNQMPNYDFEKTTGTNLTESNTFWEVTQSSHITNQLVANAGVTGASKKGLVLTLANASSSGEFRLTPRYRVSAKAGQIVTFVAAIKSPSIDKRVTFEIRLRCYDASNSSSSGYDQLIQEIYYGLEDLGSNETTVINDFIYPKYVATFVMPPGSAYAYPLFYVKHSSGTIMRSLTIDHLYLGVHGGY